jgi:hypothetical protein
MFRYLLYITFFMHGLSVLVSFSGLKTDRLMADGADANEEWRGVHGARFLPEGRGSPKKVIT